MTRPAPALPPADVFRDEHLTARDAWAAVEQAHGSEVIGGVPSKFSRTPGGVWRACPDIGADTDEGRRLLLEE